MSPKTMPTRISAIPPRRKSRRALMAANPASSDSRVEDMILSAGVADMAPLGLLRLEGKLQRQLNLPRIEHRARRTVKRVRRAFQVSSCAAAAECRRVRRAEIRSAIDRVEKTDVRGVEKVESLGD